jgi:D-3-phosphoglycerate dehydrogenase
MQIQVYRLSASSYQNHQFFRAEKAKLESLRNVIYCESSSQIQPEIPLVLISNTHTILERLPENLLEQTALLIHPNSGHDNFKLSAIQKMKFPIILGNPIRRNAVVEYILACIFQHMTPIANHHYWSETRVWDRSLLTNKKILILGEGHIGSKISQILNLLSDNVITYDPYKIKRTNEEKDIQQEIIQYAIETDILILASSLNEHNQKIINKNILKKLSDQVLIINPARGSLVDEQDLCAFLEKNPKSYCYLDVFEEEPFKPGYLSEIKNLNKTSHIAGVYQSLNEDIINFEYEIIENFIKAYQENNIESFKHQFKSCLLENRIANNFII